MKAQKQIQRENLLIEKAQAKALKTHKGIGGRLADIGLGFGKGLSKLNQMQNQPVTSRRPSKRKVYSSNMDFNMPIMDFGVPSLDISGRKRRKKDIQWF